MILQGSFSAFMGDGLHLLVTERVHFLALFHSSYFIYLFIYLLWWTLSCDLRQNLQLLMMATEKHGITYV